MVHPRHLAQSADGTPKLLKSAEVGFALAEYSNGDDVDPVRLDYADQCHAKFLQRQARLANAPARKRTQPASKATQPATASPRKRRQTATAQAALPAPATRNLRSKRNRHSTQHTTGTINEVPSPGGVMALP